jgi:CDP-diacylglycerol---glycerol-3-phosphate 3-phosphatidyltransferase
MAGAALESRLRHIQEDSAIFTIPNILTLSRLVSAPVFLLLFFGCDGLFGENDWIRYLLCLILVVLSEISDGLDGFFARRLKQVSDFGKLMDPYADSAFRLTVMFSFAGSSANWVPLWMVVVLLYRDILTSVARVFAIKRGVVIAARISGKIKAVSQGLAIVTILTAAIMHETMEQVPGFMVWLGGPGSRLGAGSPGYPAIMWGVVAIAIWSGMDYAWSSRRHFIAAAQITDQDSEINEEENPEA